MKLSEAFEQYGFLLVVAAVFLVVGLVAAANILWGLVTGGPRDRQKPGAPYLYDRMYYLLSVLVATGWWLAMLSVPAQMANGLTAKDPVFDGFLVGWGIMAVGIGALFALRRDMMHDGSSYLAKHGFVLFRFFHAAQLRQVDRMNAGLTFLPWIFLIAGTGVLLFNITKLTEAVMQSMEGAHVVWNFIRGLQLA